MQAVGFRPFFPSYMRIDSIHGAIFLAVFLILAAARALNGQESQCVTPELDQSIAAVHPQAGTIVEILAGVGRQSAICFGLDIRDRAVLKERFSLDESHNTLRKLLTVLGARTHYSLDGAVAIIRVGKPGQKDWLDATLPEFHTEKGVIELASAKLSEYLLVRSHPGTGYVGSISSSFDSPVVEPFVVRNGTVASILSRIVTKSARAGMWFTVGPHTARLPLPSPDFWTLLTYSDPPTRDKAKIDGAMRQYY